MMKKTDEIKEYWRNNPTEESKKVAEMFDISNAHARSLKHASGITHATAFENLQKIIDQQKEEIEKLKAIIRTLMQ
jgi:hypothetical protein